MLGLTTKKQIDLAVSRLAIAVFDELQAGVWFFIFEARFLPRRPDHEHVVGAVGDMAAASHIQLAWRLVLGLTFPRMPN
ncbi:hypothetical protein BUW96_13630 [Achromobacter insolitus]|nr:hypothetical protein BUW96_13630 [Achromobacter insolitus]OWT56447.1 hypothetical protein CEY08_22340 [Achromobacter insolitus]